MVPPTETGHLPVNRGKWHNFAFGFNRPIRRRGPKIALESGTLSLSYPQLNLFLTAGLCSAVHQNAHDEELPSRSVSRRSDCAQILHLRLPALESAQNDRRTTEARYRR